MASGELALSAVGLLLLTQVGGAGGLLLVMLAVVAFGVGSALPEQAGSAASLSETSNEFGSTIGLTILGAAVYRHQMTAAIPSGVAMHC